MQNLIRSRQFDATLEVETTDIGFRVFVNSRSPQTRRKAAAQFVQAFKKRVLDDYNLLVQYDKPFELRVMQRAAHRFLSLLKDGAGGAVTAKEIKKGFLYVNDVKLAPEFLVPDAARWDNFLPTLAGYIRGWRNRAPAGPPEGILFDLFAAEYAAGKGVFDLNDVMSINEDEEREEDAMREESAMEAT
jgi:hypothetical protein